ncbi:50S ribosomal protein L31e [Candidatus Pacearchaeota archaeon]|nr:50S ribosomal protein L31e [Candidatus Pacearchaeota archaeon]
MADKKAENKVVLERIYIVPLSAKLRPVPRYKRAKKAVKLVREFMARHMKVEERDVSKVKIDKLLNHELWFRGIRKPPVKIKVKAKKMSDGNVIVELAEIPKILQFKINREAKKSEAASKEEKAEEKKEVKEEKAEEGKEEEKKEAEEKKAAVVEAGFKHQEMEAKKQKHQIMEKPVKRQTPVQRNIPRGK